MDPFYYPHGLRESVTRVEHRASELEDRVAALEATHDAEKGRDGPDPSLVSLQARMGIQDTNPTIPPFPAGSNPEPQLAATIVAGGLDIKVEPVGGCLLLPELHPPAVGSTAAAETVALRVFALLDTLDCEAVAGQESCQPTSISAHELREAGGSIGDVLGLVFRLAELEALKDNGAGWMVWSRVWLGLLLLQHLSDGDDLRAEEEHAPEARDFMRAILGIDGKDGEPDIQEMAARLWG